MAFFSFSKLKIGKMSKKGKKSQASDLVEDCQLMRRENYSDLLFYDFHQSDTYNKGMHFHF